MLFIEVGTSVSRPIYPWLIRLMLMQVEVKWSQLDVTRVHLLGPTGVSQAELSKWAHLCCVVGTQVEKVCIKMKM